MAQKLLLFWRKPARRCWWEGVELDNVEGVQGKLKVWIRRVWTLEMVRDSLPCRELFVQTQTGCGRCGRLLLITFTERYWIALGACIVIIIQSE